MSASGGTDKFERERLDADARYNDALTALDRAIVERRGAPIEGGDVGRLTHALIIFLQQITAFVDTKDRALAADVDARFERLERSLADIDELRTRLNVLQRQARQSAPPSTAPPAAGEPTVSAQPPSADVVYVGFEDCFRGSDETVAAKLQTYVPLFAGASDVVDLGCGRGEFLDALRAAGVPARGVDTNAEMVASARERGLDVQHGDALAFLRSRADASLGGAIATQVIEHLEPSYLLQLVEALARALRPGAPLVLETINPACWLAFFSSYIRDFTHVRPIHPETLQFLLRAGGFERVEIRYSAPVPEQMKLRSVDLPASVLSSTDPTVAAIAAVGHAVNAHAAILNSLMFTHLDYAVVGYRA